MILTFTPNPSVDLLFRAERLVWDDANRVPSPRRRAGGQGLNVARAARALGGEARAVTPLGGAAGRELEEMLAREGLPLDVVPIEGETRVFVAAREVETGRSLLLNPGGPRLAPAEGDALREAVLRALAARPRWLACCGSLPPGLPPDLYARLGARARADGIRFVADCDGEPLRLALEAGCDLLVPNHHEAGRLLGIAVDDVASSARAARALGERGVGTVAVTLGAEGAVLWEGGRAWHAAAPPAPGGVAVGAGDAFLAALLLAAIEDPPARLRRAVAAGTAVLHGDGATLLEADVARRLADAVRVVQLD